jgi:hypothetical protein
VISLALRGKLHVTEDTVTAAFIDLLRYEADAALLGTILRMSKPVRDGWPIPVFDDFEAELWPNLMGREPDARITLLSAKTVVASVVVESKLGASKSGHGELDVEKPGGDQLADYLRHEAMRVAPTRAVLIYLTHHAAMPKGDLEDSVRHLAKHGHHDLAHNLFWLSWRDAHEALENNASESRHRQDVVALLHRVQMFRFRAIGIRLLGSMGVSAFYTGRARDRRFVDATKELGPLGPCVWAYRGAMSTRKYKWAPFPGPITSSRFYKETA